jgi:hypothetical protein
VIPAYFHVMRFTQHQTQIHTPSGYQDLRLADGSFSPLGDSLFFARAKELSINVKAQKKARPQKPSHCALEQFPGRR